MPPKTKSLSVPEAAQPRYNEITALTDDEQKLVEQYYQIGNQVTKFEQQLRHQQQQDSQRELQLTQINQSLLQAQNKHQVLTEQHQQAVVLQQAIEPQVSDAKLQLEVFDEQIHIVDEAFDVFGFGRFVGRGF